MASITKRKSGAYTVKVYFKHSYQDTIRLSTKNRREAERTAEKIQDIVNSIKNGTSTPEADAWLAKLRESDAKLYDKLVALGLANRIQKKEQHSLPSLASAYVSQARVNEATVKKYMKCALLLEDILGKVEVDSITVEQANQAVAFIRTAPLNQRSKPPRPLAESHSNRTVVFIKTLFRHAERLGWVDKSPFRFTTGGPCVNQKKWKYVPVKVFLSVLSKIKNPKWRLILSLGRLAGVRGSSELYNLRWDMVSTEKGVLSLHADKLEIHNKAERTVPMPSVLRDCFVSYRDSLGDDVGEMVFPGMAKKENFSSMTRKYIVWSGNEPWVEPWYNLRRSYCSDVMESGVDPKQYEDVCGHSFETGMKHYQIMHPDRQKRGFDKVLSALSGGGDLESVP